MVVVESDVITCRKCSWSGHKAGLSSDQGNSVKHMLCPGKNEKRCGEVLLLVVGSGAFLVKENAAIA